ncbi:MAG TPA: MBL fold metallo-hydrolase [Nitriliruptorales bacterium]|nr:MBL fold metallo-hydrolase [Nitriliruptorales bacterium]
MSFDVVVLGSAGTHPGPGRVCSGYLFRTDRTRVVVDCGNGSTSNLYRILPLEQLDAVILTHRHHDHCADLIGLYYALRFHPDGERSIDVLAPPGTAPFLAQMLSDDAAQRFHEVCCFRDVAHGDHVTIGDLDFTFFDSPHAVPSVAVRAEHRGGVATYSGDSGGGPSLQEAARDADLFLCEATWTGDPEQYPPELHLTASEAGATAQAAGVRQLVLTHLYPTNDRERALSEAQERFDGSVELADDLMVYRVGG